MPNSQIAPSFATFFSIAFVVPWVGWSLLSFGAVSTNSPFAYPLFLSGVACSIAGVVATFVDQGWRGVGQCLFSAAKIWAPLRWWLYVLFVPIVWQLSAALLFLNFTNASLLIKPQALLDLASPGLLATFLVGPLGEEFGWRGFLLPRLVPKFGEMVACFIVGIIWGVWHWPLYLDRIVESTTWAWYFLGTVTTMSFLIGVVYLRTKSLFLAMVLHWNINSVQKVMHGLVPSLPLADPDLLRWCKLGMIVLIAVFTISALAAAGRDRHSGAGSG